MSKPNLKSQAKRKRELAKLDKRQAKDLKRAEKRAERAGTGDVVTAVVTPTPQIARVVPAGARVAAVAPPAPKPLTLAAAVEQWKSAKIAKPAKARW